MPWLKDQVKSVIDALAKSAPHRRETSVPEGEDGEELIDRVEYRSFEINNLAAARSSDPERIVLEKEATEELERKVDTLFQAVDGDPELEEVLNAIISGCEPKPRYLAAELGVPVEDIYNRMKRLRRRALKGGLHEESETH